MYVYKTWKKEETSWEEEGDLQELGCKRRSQGREASQYTGYKYES